MGEGLKRAVKAARESRIRRFRCVGHGEMVSREHCFRCGKCHKIVCLNCICERKHEHPEGVDG